MNSLDVQSKLEKLVEDDIMFHVRIAELSKNVFFRNTIIAVSETWKTGVRNGFANLRENNPDILGRVYSQHKAVFDAIKSRNPEQAKKNMISHLNEVIQPF